MKSIIHAIHLIPSTLYPVFNRFSHQSPTLVSTDHKKPVVRWQVMCIFSNKSVSKSQLFLTSSAVGFSVSQGHVHFFIFSLLRPDLSDFGLALLAAPPAAAGLSGCGLLAPTMADFSNSFSMRERSALSFSSWALAAFSCWVASCCFLACRSRSAPLLRSRSSISAVMSCSQARMASRAAICCWHTRAKSLQRSS